MVTVTGMAPFGVVGLSGRADRAAAEELRIALDELLAVGVTDVTVDLHQATSVGAETVGVLVSVERVLLSAGGRLLLLGTTSATGRRVAMARSGGFCATCGTVPGCEWRWCPDCGGQLIPTGLVTSPPLPDDFLPYPGCTVAEWPPSAFS